MSPPPFAEIVCVRMYGGAKYAQKDKNFAEPAKLG